MNSFIVKNCLDCGLEVFNIYHDAIYIICQTNEEESVMKQLSACMTETLSCIRVEVHKMSTNWDTLISDWTAEKGYQELKDFGRFMV
jgi:hypothetical protein